jgi:hypothetical protein
VIFQHVLSSKPLILPQLTRGVSTAFVTLQVCRGWGTDGTFRAVTFFYCTGRTDGTFKSCGIEATAGAGVVPCQGLQTSRGVTSQLIIGG